MKFYRAIARALVECELNKGFAQIQDDNKISLTTEGCALVARNFYWALLSEKGTVK